MADGLILRTEAPSRRMQFRAAACSGLLSVCCLLSSVCAEELADPTRPPASITAPAAPASGVVASPPAGLQSIIISRNRRAAIIDGETVELGGKYGDAKLIEVHEGRVVLKSAQGRRVMTLFPDVKMTAAKTPVNSETKTGHKVKTRPQPREHKANQAADSETK